MLAGEGDKSFDIRGVGLGKERSLEEYEKASGIDFSSRVLSDNAKNGIALLT